MAQTADQELTLADVLDLFGPIPAYRVRHLPAPGTATEQDVIDIAENEDRLCELVDGVLVEKMMGFYESYLALRLGKLLSVFVDDHRLGIVVGADAMMLLAPGLVRVPDVSFISWDRLPERRVPRDPIANLAPDLAIEVLSKGNTKKEMSRKLQDYFAAGVRFVWYIDPNSQTAQCYTSPTDSLLVKTHESLDGGEVLPGFSLPLKTLFEEAQ